MAISWSFQSGDQVGVRISWIPLPVSRTIKLKLCTWIPREIVENRGENRALIAH